MICGVSSLCLGSESGQTATKPFCRLTPCMSHSVSVGQQALSAEDLSLSLWVRTRGDVGLGYTIILVYFLLCNTVFPEGRVGDGVALRPQKKNGGHYPKVFAKFFIVSWILAFQKSVLLTFLYLSAVGVKVAGHRVHSHQPVQATDGGWTADFTGLWERWNSRSWVGAKDNHWPSHTENFWLTREATKASLSTSSGPSSLYYSLCSETVSCGTM